jgi:phosphoadenosine phosphosulfate reductase
MKWCFDCNQEIFSDECPFQGKGIHNVEEIPNNAVPSQIQWCGLCKAPISVYLNDASKELCPLCGNKTKFLCTDVRPVFPAERLLFELIKGEPLKYKDCSVWVNNNKYYIDGVTHNLATKEIEGANAVAISRRLQELAKQNDDNSFQKHLNTFIKANHARLSAIKAEAFDWIRNEASKYTQEQIVISFSGGKDSTVVADLVIRALGNPSLVHIFGNTTLEFPLTLEYAKRYRADNPKSIFTTAQNRDLDFYEVAKEIGPPARMMRWCCTMFKTGPITRVINSLFRDMNILTFYGIRKCESVSRSKYNRADDEETSARVKITKQKVASPIFFWIDADIWLYILGEKIDFNDAYKLGYDRVGCWCCPNNNQRAQFLAQIYMAEEFYKWRSFLIDFARRIGKPDAEVYVDSGAWKARQGGAGVAAAESVKIKFTNCTAEENAKVYQLEQPIRDDFYTLFTPFGKVSKELGRKIVGEILVLDLHTSTPILSVQPMNSGNYRYAVKVKTLAFVEKHEDLQRMVSYQIRKWNACRMCLKCESLCKFGAITITKGSYKISDEKCARCKLCVSQQYLTGGCLMSRFLKQKNEEVI